MRDKINIIDKDFNTEKEEKKYTIQIYEYTFEDGETIGYIDISTLVRCVNPNFYNYMFGHKYKNEIHELI